MIAFAVNVFKITWSWEIFFRHWFRKLNFDQILSCQDRFKTSNNKFWPSLIERKFPWSVYWRLVYNLIYPDRQKNGKVVFFSRHFGLFGKLDVANFQVFIDLGLMAFRRVLFFDLWHRFFCLSTTKISPNEWKLKCRGYRSRFLNTFYVGNNWLFK